MLDGEAHAPLEAGPFARAVELLDRAVALDPYDGCLRERLALALYFDGRLQPALAELKQARRACGDIGIDYLEAELLSRDERWPEAATAFERISQAYPQHVTPLFMLGQLYLRLGRPADAARALQAVVAMPDSEHNLKLDRAKVRRQRELAQELLDNAPQLAAWREGP
jgi:predicted Zn-dependent protease